MLFFHASRVYVLRFGTVSQYLMCSKTWFWLGIQYTCTSVWIFLQCFWAYGVVDQSIEQCAIFYYATFKLTPSMHR